MTYPINKQKNSERGVTLLVAIVVLSAILAIVFSMATILFMEIRTSNDLVKTEGAYYGADAVTEEALFKIKRSVDTGFYYSTKVGQTIISAPIESSTTSNVFQDKVPTTAIDLNTAERYPLYDTANTAGGSGFSKIKITNLSSDQNTILRIYICQFDPTGLTQYTTPACSDPNSTEYWVMNAQDFHLYGSNVKTWDNLNLNLQQEIILLNTNAVPVWFQIEGFGENDVPKGIPLIGEKTVDVKAENNGVSRKIRLAVPRSSSGGSVSSGAQGQYVRVQLSGADYLSLAELQVMGTLGTNLAPGKTTSQSSTGFGGIPNRAVDNNTDGLWANNSVTHTNLESNAWWQVDLGASAIISSIVVWNRTDCCSTRLGDYWVFVSDTPFNPSDTPAILQSRANTWSSHQIVYPNPSTIISTGGSSATQYSLWSNLFVPATPDIGANPPLELGVRFKSNVNGSVVGVKFYKSALNTGTHVGHLWNSSGSLLGTVTFTGETASGWQQANFASPIAITANTMYTVSYSSQNGHWSTNGNDFASACVTNGPLTASQNGTDGGFNGVYIYSPGSFPASGYGNNYVVDLVFQ